MLCIRAKRYRGEKAERNMFILALLDFAIQAAFYVLFVIIFDDLHDLDLKKSYTYAQMQSQMQIMQSSRGASCKCCHHKDVRNRLLLLTTWNRGGRSLLFTTTTIRSTKI
ncbi:hypothetical protein Q1695_011097 [Nippostrongylus brasiliensis]|nr:hypothetical protein Q1695_011097 [Nippostrongylus brasiliensis]